VAARARRSTSLDDASRSASGKPLLANDPHLGLAAPALWYLAHLSAPGLEVIGATLPGLPYVVVRRSDRLAWGFTNTLPAARTSVSSRSTHPTPRATPHRTAGGAARLP